MEGRILNSLSPDALLAVLADGQERTSTQIREAPADQFSLSAEELAEQIPSGRAKTFANRVAWAMTHMYHRYPRRLVQSPASSSHRAIQSSVWRLAFPSIPSALASGTSTCGLPRATPPHAPNRSTTSPTCSTAATRPPAAPVGRCSRQQMSEFEVDDEAYPAGIGANPGDFRPTLSWMCAPPRSRTRFRRHSPVRYASVPRR
jgi:Mrr N-terminal domain